MQRQSGKQGKALARGARAKPASPLAGQWASRRDKGKPAEPGEARVHATRVGAVMAAAAQSGLLAEKSGRIGGRVSAALVRKAKDSTGIESDTDLIEFALANVALEDRFAESFAKVRGTVDRDLKLGF